MQLILCGPAEREGGDYEATSSEQILLVVGVCRRALCEDDIAWQGIQTRLAYLARLFQDLRAL